MEKVFTIFISLLIYIHSNAQYLIDESFESTILPAEGWSYHSVTHGINNPRTGQRSLTFNSRDDYAITPLLINPDSLFFWFKRSTNSTDWSASVEILDTDEQVILTLPNLTDPSTTWAKYTADLSSYTNIKIKITDTRESGGHERYLDDFIVTESLLPKIISSKKTIHHTPYDSGNGPSAIDSFYLYGLNLHHLDDELTLNLSNPNFEISNHPSGPFSSKLTMPYTNGSIKTNIYTRLAAALPTDFYQAQLTIEGGTANAMSLDLNGEVTTPDPPFCTPSVSTFTIYPTSGPEGTEIRISRSGAQVGNFHHVTAVRFGDIPASSFKIESTDTIYATVPNGTTNNKVILIDEAGCLRSNSSTNFTFNKINGNCSPTYTDLIISEVYSSSSQQNYIEIYNGTGNAINLTKNNYNIRLIKKPQNNILTMSITGYIAPEETAIYYIGNEGDLANGSQSSSLIDLDSSDHIILRRGSKTIDVFEVPNNVDFNFRRAQHINGPTSSFNSADWISHIPISTIDIGHFQPTTPIEIISHPMSVESCGINLNISTDSNESLEYKWYYNNNRDSTATASRSWNLLADGTYQLDDFKVSGSTTKDLTITGDLSKFIHNQFYCIVSDGNCFKYSKVAHFNVFQNRHYRSKQSGDWKKASTWEMSANNDPNSWTDACTFPWDTNLMTVEILEGHHIIVIDNPKITPDVQISSLTIQEGGTLEIEANAELFINDYAETDLNVLGTLYDKGNSGKDNGVTFLTNANWKLGNNGILIKAGRSTANHYKNAYKNGIEHIPATAHWIYRRENSNEPDPIAIDMFYPNLYFENTYSNNWAPNLTGSSGFTTVKGDLVLRGDHPIFLTNTNTHPTPFSILGDLIIHENNTLRLYTSPLSEAGTGIAVSGNIHNNGVIDVNRDDTYIRLTGDTDQSIDGSGNLNIGKLEITKPNKTAINLNVDLNINIQLAFQGGIINTQHHQVTVTNTDPANAIVGFEPPNETGIYSDDNYIIGQLKRKMGTPNSTYIFPVGVSSIGYNPARITVNQVPDPNSYTTGQFIHSYPGLINVHRTFDCNGSIKFLEYDQLTNEGYWKFDSPHVFEAYTINIHPNFLNKNIYPNEDDPRGYSQSYRVLKEDASKAGAPWDADVSTQGDPCHVSYNYYDIVGSGYTGFSIFAPGGGDDISTALPIELLYFEKRCTPSPHLNWATASEWNARYFTIEKSTNGIDFEAIENIDATGFSNKETTYSYALSNYDKSEYYRLTETSWSGEKSYHKIISSTCTNNFISKSKVFYNDQKEIVIQFNDKRRPPKVQIFDTMGRFVSNPMAFSPHAEATINFQHLAKGLYFVTLIYDNQEVETHKVLVH